MDEQRGESKGEEVMGYQLRASAVQGQRRSPERVGVVTRSV